MHFTLTELLILSLLPFTIVMVVLVYKRDQKWYERHPGAEERLGDIDDDLHDHGL
jgi:hypothetical protein